MLGNVLGKISFAFLDQNTIFQMAITILEYFAKQSDNKIDDLIVAQLKDAFYNKKDAVTVVNNDSGIN